MDSYYIKRAKELYQKEGISRLFSKSFEHFQIKICNFVKNIHFHSHTNRNDIKNKILYDVPPDPYMTISVDSNEINHIIHDRNISPIAKPHKGGFAQIKRGSWPSKDNLIELDDYFIKTSLIQRFEKQVEWHNTEYYDVLINKGFSDQEAIEKLNNYDYLYNSIKGKGFKKNYTDSTYRGTSGYRAKLEPFVIIDETGKIYLWDGRHRFCIAQMLGLEVPVHVLCRHKKWQNIRENIYKNGLSENYDRELEDHPDLKDILT